MIKNCKMLHLLQNLTLLAFRNQKSHTAYRNFPSSHSTFTFRETFCLGNLPAENFINFFQLLPAVIRPFIELYVLFRHEIFYASIQHLPSRFNIFHWVYWPRISTYLDAVIFLYRGNINFTSICKMKFIQFKKEPVSREITISRSSKFLWRCLPVLKQRYQKRLNWDIGEERQEKFKKSKLLFNFCLK